SAYCSTDNQRMTRIPQRNPIAWTTTCAEPVMAISLDHSRAFAKRGCVGAGGLASRLLVSIWGAGGFGK
ncbi:hypothetical protein, partial [Rhodopirellula bahusiensis]|uniref:hypothetical protein n=1 Tax=Rhodopirellula bahusiensis TaxID=2014065 RepID=UPI0032975B94